MEQIQDDDELYRRLAPEHVNPDGAVNSAAFELRRDYDRGISVDLARLTTPRQTLSSHPTFGVGILVAAVPRGLGFDVRHDPLPDDPAHALIEGDNNREKSRRLAEAVSVLIQPQQRDRSTS